MLEELRQKCWRLNLELPKNHLVVWTSGNVSLRDPKSGLVLIKPSGVRYEDLQPKDIVIMNMEGKVVEGNCSPSSDTSSISGWV